MPKQRGAQEKGDPLHVKNNVNNNYPKLETPKTSIKRSTSVGKKTSGKKY